jgi:hypothetical protein
MNLIRINRNPSRRQLAVFGLLWLVFFGILGHTVQRRTGLHWAAWSVWALAVAVPVAGWLVPPILRMAYLGLSYATAPIGIVVSFVILAVIYYLVLTPTGLLMRLLGHDPLSRHFDPDARSYWVEREALRSADRYFRQF